MVDLVVGLGEDSTNCYRGGVDMRMEAYRPVWKFQNGCFDQLSFEQLEGVVAVL